MKIAVIQNLIDIVRGKRKPKLKYKIYMSLFHIKKNFFLNVLSDNRPKILPKIIQPTLFLGNGNLELSPECQFGYYPSANLFDSSCYVEARCKDSYIKIGHGTYINNCARVVSYRGGVIIGCNCLIGLNFTCVNTDSHSTNPLCRNNENEIDCKDIKIGNNVFIGNNVTILKGGEIGNGCTIGAGSVVTKSFADNNIIAGNPARIIKRLEIND